MNNYRQAYLKGLIGQCVKSAQTDDPDQVYFHPRKNKPIRGTMSRLVYGNVPGADESTHEDIVRIARILREAYPDELRDTSMHVGRPSLDNMLNRLEATQHHDTGLGRLFSTREDLASILANQTDAGLEQFPSAYIPQGDMAILPEGSPGVALHELGHAIDLNKPLAKGHRYRRALKSTLKPTLLQEYDAWRRPTSALAEHAAKNPEDEEFIRRILFEAYKRKYPAMGTYIGGATGAIGGAAAGLGLDLLATGRTGYGPIIGALLGGTLGATGGAFVGKSRMTDDRADRRVEDLLRRAVRAKQRREKRGQVDDTPLARLIAAKGRSDQGDYAKKTEMIRQLMAERPDEFIVDSDEGHVLGLTHTPTNFRFHLERAAVPAGIQRPGTN